MKESKFIEQNKNKWDEFEKMLSSEDKDPNKLSDLFVQITDDLSFAKTFYPNRSVRYYLNNLAQQIFYSINKGKKNEFKNFKEFWTLQIPKAVFDSRKQLLLSLVLFLVAVIIGIFSTRTDPEFANLILGKDYVDMTMENISKGDPLGVYKKPDQFNMFLGITINNIRVAILTFIFGVLFSAGTILIMLYNGIMVGTFQYFFISKGLFWESFLTIWLHGTLEISAIIIAGGAGLKLGSGLIFPGTYSRMQAFKISGRKGLIVLISIVPILTLAGMIEGFITRYTDAHYAVRALLIFVSLCFIVGYYIVLPYFKNRSGAFSSIKEERLPPANVVPIDFKAIHTVGEIFSLNFILYKKHFYTIFRWVIPVAIVYTISVSLVLFNTLPEYLYDIDFFFIANLFDYDSPLGHMMALANFIAIGLNLFGTYFLIEKSINKEISRENIFIRILQCIIISGSIQLINFFHSGVLILFIIFVIPLFLYWCTIQMDEKSNLTTSLIRAKNLTIAGYGRILLLFLILSASATLYFLLIGSPFTFMYFSVLEMNLEMDLHTRRQVLILFSTFISFLALQLIIPLFIFGYTLSYFTVREMFDAKYLKERIMNFGSKTKNVYKA